MEMHEHKKQLARMQADRIASLELKLRLNPDNKLLKQHLSLMKKTNDNQRTLRENQQNQLSDFS